MKPKNWNYYKTKEKFIMQKKDIIFTKTKKKKQKKGKI